MREGRSGRASPSTTSRSSGPTSSAEVVGTARVGGNRPWSRTVAGRGWITDIGQYGCDPEDPFPEGYTLSDTWLKAI